MFASIKKKYLFLGVNAGFYSFGTEIAEISNFTP
jgi:hypothetical protein